MWNGKPFRSYKCQNKWEFSYDKYCMVGLSLIPYKLEEALQMMHHVSGVGWWKSLFYISLGIASWLGEFGVSCCLIMLMLNFFLCQKNNDWFLMFFKVGMSIWRIVLVGAFFLLWLVGGCRGEGMILHSRMSCLMDNQLLSFLSKLSNVQQLGFLILISTILVQLNMRC